MKKLKTILFLLAILFGSTTTHAAIRYVSTTGTDSGDALTEGTAWGSLNHADTTATAGDTIRVLPGTYEEDEASLHCLVMTNNLTWVAYGGTVTIQSVSTSYVLVAQNDVVTAVTGFTLDGESNTATCVYLATGANTKTFTDCIFLNPSAYYLQNSNDSDEITVSGGSGTGGALTYGFLLGNLTNFSISNFQSSQTSGSLLNAVSSGAISISGGSVTYSSASGTYVVYVSGGTGALVIDGLTVTADDASQSNNLITSSNRPTPIIRNCVTSSIGTTSAVIHIQVISTGTSVGAATVNGNTCSTSSLTGQTIIIGTDSTSAGDDKLNGSMVYDNQLYGPFYQNSAATEVGTHGIEIGYNNNGHVFRNYITGYYYGVVLKGDNEDYLNDGGVYFNVIVDCGGDSQAGSSYIRVKGIDNVNVFNNTLVVSSTITAPAGAMLHITDGDVATDEADNTVVKNNLFYTDLSGKFIYMENDGSTIAASDVDNNLYYSSQTLAWTIGATSYNSWSGWQGADYDASGVNSDPLLDSSYMIGVGSPAEKAGTQAGDFSYIGWQTDPFGGSYLITPTDILNIGAGQLRSEASEKAKPRTKGQAIYGGSLE